MSRFIASLSLVCGTVFISEEGRSATIHVPADYSTINAALDAASSGDIVEVAPGTYDQIDTRPLWAGDNVSSVAFLKSGVVLRSSGGADVTTLRIDATPAKPAIVFGNSGEFHVDGFTLTGSVADLVAVAINTPDGPVAFLKMENCVVRDYGMGTDLSHEYALDTYNADVEIRNCRFANLDCYYAVPVFLYSAHNLFEDCQFENCSGGGIFMSTLSDPSESLVVRRCSFEENTAGAIATLGIRTILIEDCWFHGDWISCDGSWLTSSVTVRNNSFWKSSDTFPAVSVFANQAEVSGNTFYGGGTGPTAVYFLGILPGSTLTLERNVVSFYSQDGVEVSQGGGQSGCNVFWQNAGGHTSGFSLGPTDLVADPQFCNGPAADLTVNAASPCLPWNNDGCGQIGAWGLGCGTVSVEPSSWGQIKALYR